MPTIDLGKVQADEPTTASVLALVTGSAVSSRVNGTLAIGDAGKIIYATGDLHIPSSVFSAGNVINIDNTTSSAIDVTSDITLRIAGTDNIGDIQIAAYGFCSILIEPSGAKIMGEGIALNLDANAITFLTAAGITTGTVKTAVSTLVESMKTANIWTKMIAVYPFVQNTGGTSTTPHSYNLKNPALYQLTWEGALQARDLGVDTVGGSADTGLNMNTLTQNSLAFGCYNRKSVQSSTLMGAFTTSDGISIIPWFGDGNAYIDNQWNGAAGRVTAAVSDAYGLYVSSRTASNLHSAYKRGVLLGSTTGASSTLVNQNILLFKRAPVDAPIGADLAFAFVSTGLTGAEVTALNTAVETFQTALARGV